MRGLTTIAVGSVLVMSLVLVLGACAASGPQLKADGIPAWVDQPCAGQPAVALCAVGESDLAAANVEAAKTDAETAAKNKIVDQISAKVGRLTERLNSAMKDLSNGQIVGERTVKDINRNFQEMTIGGLRYVEYFFLPDRLSPKRVWVRAVVTVDSNKMSQDIVNAMMRGATEQKLEMKHEEAMNRFDAVRKQYLDEEAAAQAKAHPAPAPQQ